MLRTFLRCGLALLLPLWLLGCDCAGSPGPGMYDASAPDTGPAPMPDSGAGDGGVEDTCDNGLDDDRDGRVDEECQCTPGRDQACYGGDPALAGIGGCSWGAQRCYRSGEFGLWDMCVGWGRPGEEVCDGIDNDCDGTTDEGCDCLPGDTRLCYDGPPVTEGVGSCVAGRLTCIETATGSMWSGCEGSSGPSEEVCDGSGDEDCDERIDEGCTCLFDDTQDCYGGPPGTEGVGTCAAGTQTCVSAGAGETEWGACTGETRPSAELCDGGADEDCDGLTDCDDPDCEASCCEGFSESVAIVPAEGELMFLVDRSGSMQWPAVDTSASRWAELETAMGSVMPSLTELHLGLLTFPERNGTDEQLWCGVATAPDIGLAVGTGGSILSRLMAAPPRAGDTPTPQALGVVDDYLSSITTSRERFLILATDGLPEPNCGATVDATVTAISALRSAGVDTFVLGIVGPDPDGDLSGLPALQDGLNQMADAGGRARSGTVRYYEAGDGAALTGALEDIIAAATNCTVELSSLPPGPYEVRQDGALVPTWGYSLVGTRLEFLGAYCDRIQAGVVSSITVGDVCGG